MSLDWKSGKITDEGMEFMRSRIGQKVPLRAWDNVATKDAIWHFALGVGDDNPLWWDEDYAKCTRWGGLIAPPTFLYSASSGPRSADDPAGASVEDLLPGVFGVWAGETWRWFSPVRKDEEITGELELAEATEKPSKTGGKMVVQIDRQTFYGTDGRKLAEVDKTRIRLEREATRSNAAYLDREPARYSPEDAEKIKAHYRQEAGQRRGGEPRYFEDVKVGDPLLTLAKGPLTVTNIVGWLLGWGSTLCPTNRIASLYLDRSPGARLLNEESNIEDTIEGAHWDSYFARQSGFATGYDFGGQRISWFAHLLTDWGGDDAELKELEVRLRRPNFLGDTQWISGTVTGTRREGEAGLVDCAIEATNQNGELTTTATATIALPVRG